MPRGGAAAALAVGVAAAAAATASLSSGYKTIRHDMTPLRHGFWLSSQSPSSCRRAAFLVPTTISQRQGHGPLLPFGRLGVAAEPSALEDATLYDDDDDEQLLQEVPESMLMDLCVKCHLSAEGSPQELLQRLRQYAAEQTAAQIEIQKDRHRRVEAGSDADGSSPLEGSRAKHRIVKDADGGKQEQAMEEEEVFVYIPLASNATRSSEEDELQANATKGSGERITTIYSTKDRNDLTGLTSQADRLYGGVSTSDASAVEGSPLAATLGGGGGGGGGMGEAAASSGEGGEGEATPSKTNEELEESRTAVRNVFSELLELTGFPQFRSEDYIVPADEAAPTGFRPEDVPASLLTEASPHLRAAGGDVLREITSEWEIQGIGLDGLAADDEERGGGHYRQVSKVAAFLEGFRQAEVQRVARETLSMLLNVLVTRGVEGLDTTLATMKRGVGGGEAEGEVLNDALLEFLDDVIGQQQEKVDLSVGGKAMTDRRMGVQGSLESRGGEVARSVSQKNGKKEETVEETINPNDPSVLRQLEEEGEEEAPPPLPTQESPVEQSLLLLTLLRDRLKTEAMFAQDERTKGLKVLAYCLRATTDSDRERLILDYLGSSLERLEAFADLVEGAMEYGESTSYQLQPLKRNTLNLVQLKKISRLVGDIRQRQLQKASGLAP